jgi:hypothetical protein
MLNVTKVHDSGLGEIFYIEVKLRPQAVWETVLTAVESEKKVGGAEGTYEKLNVSIAW